MPTCLELVGAKYPKKYKGNNIFPLDGQSFWPLVLGENYISKRQLYFQHEGNVAIRQDNWKLVKRHNKNWELYVIFKDPTELNDVSRKDSVKRNMLEEKCSKWEKEYGVLTWPITIDKKKK